LIHAVDKQNEMNQVINKEFRYHIAGLSLDFCTVMARIGLKKESDFEFVELGYIYVTE
jgi:hypothetical protein